MSTDEKFKVYHSLLNVQFWLLPGTCVLCNRASGRHRDLCDACETALPFIRHPCLRCGLPLPSDGTRRNPCCGRCTRLAPPFRHCLSPLLYRPPVDRLVAGLKFHGRLQAGKLLALLLARHLEEFYRGREAPSLILPVPLHPGRLRRRGYNQARELAREVSTMLHVPVDWRRCARTLPTRPQTGLSARQRRRNLRGAFALAGPPLPDRVALLDDVVTTTSTVREISRLLLEGGAKEVDVWAAARA